MSAPPTKSQGFMPTICINGNEDVANALRSGVIAKYRNSSHLDLFFFCYVSYGLNYNFHCWICYVSCYNFVTAPSNNCYCCLFVRRVKPRLNFIANLKNKQTTAKFLFESFATFTPYISLYHSNPSPPSLLPSSYGGDSAFTKSIIGFIWWLERLKKLNEEKWPSLPSSSPVSSLPASSTQKMPETPISWSAQKKSPEDYANQRAKYTKFFIGNRILPIL